MARHRRTRRRRLGDGVQLLGRARKVRKAKKATACKTARGKLRKGWRYGKGGRCIRAKGKR